jgi:hypothetical protein
VADRKELDDADFKCKFLVIVTNHFFCKEVKAKKAFGRTGEGSRSGAAKKLPVSERLGKVDSRQE